MRQRLRKPPAPRRSQRLRSRRRRRMLPGRRKRQSPKSAQKMRSRQRRQLRRLWLASGKEKLLLKELKPILSSPRPLLPPAMTRLKTLPPKTPRLPKKSRLRPNRLVYRAVDRASSGRPSAAGFRNCRKSSPKNLPMKPPEKLLKRPGGRSSTPPQRVKPRPRLLTHTGMPRTLLRSTADERILNPGRSPMNPCGSSSPRARTSS